MPGPAARPVASRPARGPRRTGLSLAVAGVAAVVALGSALAPAESAGADGPMGRADPQSVVAHQGRWLVDQKGRVLLLHGVNMVEKTAPYYPSSGGFSDADAAWLADNGLRVVRVGILATGLMPRPGPVDERYISHIVATVNDLRRHGIYAMIDFHQDGYGPTVGSDGFPDWMTLTGSAVNNHVGFPLYYADDPATQQAFQSFWDNARGPDGRPLQSDYVAMFHAVAERFAGNPAVLGYDLFNEPWPGTVWQPCLATTGCPGLDHSELGPLYAAAVQGIRSAGDSHLIFGEPFTLFNFGVSPTSIPLPGNDPRAGLSFHMYTTDPTKDPNVIANAIGWSAATGGALMNTEWGAVTDSTAIERQAGELDAALVPWIFWSISEVVSNLNLPPSGANLVASTVAALVRPYPLAVAGTPKTLAYSPAGRMLSFGWSTARPGGGSYEPGTHTEVVAPATVYPTGYHVSVRGGRVTSPPCASTISVANLPGDHRVRLRVSPADSCPDGLG